MTETRATARSDDRADRSGRRVAVLVIAYQAGGTIGAVLDRIPPTVVGVAPRVVVADDASSDDTAAVARAWADGDRAWPVDVVRRDRNLGYGGNQIAGYLDAVRAGDDVVVVIHGDGQYPPEDIDRLVAPIVDGRADAVFGSRMMTRGAARRGGMPLDRFVGNRALSALQNALTGARLSEWHSGFRAYRVATLAALDVATLPTGFDFDTAITLRLLEHRAAILEVAIPTRYADEISYINPYRTGLDIIRHTLRHRRRRSRIGGSA